MLPYLNSSLILLSAIKRQRKAKRVLDVRPNQDDSIASNASTDEEDTFSINSSVVETVVRIQWTLMQRIHDALQNKENEEFKKTIEAKLNRNAIMERLACSTSAVVPHVVRALAVDLCSFLSSDDRKAVAETSANDLVQLLSREESHNVCESVVHFLLSMDCKSGTPVFQLLSALLSSLSGNRSKSRGAGVETWSRSLRFKALAVIIDALLVCTCVYHSDFDHIHHFVYRPGNTHLHCSGTPLM